MFHVRNKNKKSDFFFCRVKDIFWLGRGKYTPLFQLNGRFLSSGW